MTENFETALLKVLTDIHKELIVANCLTKKDKMDQRDIFDLENQYHALYKQYELVENQIEKWCLENLEEDSTLSMQELKELIPELITKYEQLDIKIDRVEHTLKLYKNDGNFVVGVPL